MSIYYRPDLRRTQSPGPQEIVYSITGGFFPTNNFGMKRSPGASTTSYTASIAGVALGAAMVSKSDGTNRLIVGSQKKLEEANGTTGWTDRSNATTYSATDIWTFAQFGDDTIATSKNDPVQVSTGAGFSDLGGSPPKAKFVVVQSNVVLLLNINDGTDRPDWWASSDQNSDSTWTAAATNFADKDRLYGGIGGPITAAGTWQSEVLAWKRNAMYRGRFTGDLDQPWVWDFVTTSHGCPSPFGHVETEVGRVWVSDRDILLYDGSPPRSIADNVRQAFLNDIGTNTSSAFCTLDEANNLVWIWYIAAGSGASYPNRALFWNWKTGEFGKGDDFGPITAPTTPVRDARYAAWGSSPIDGDSATTANLVFADGPKIWNMNGHQTGASSLDFYLHGRADADMQFSRIRPEYRLGSASTGATLGVNLYSADISSLPIVQDTVTAKSDLSWDYNKPFRYAQLRFNAPAVNAPATIAPELISLLPEYVDFGGPRAVGRR